jgi:tetratricopeptide (TPR) repeat protein
LAATWTILIAVMWSGPRVHSAGFSSGVDPWTYLLNQTVMISRYIRLVLWPRSLVVHYGWPRPLSPSDVWPYALFVIAMLGLTAIGLARRPAPGLAGAWFFVTLAPTSSVIPIATEVGAERRMYLPSIALILLAVFVIRRVTNPRTGAILLTFAATALAAATFTRNQEYASGLTLARTVVDRWPSAVADHLLGNELAIAGQHDQAIARLREAVDRGDQRARYDLGGELYNAGKLNEAIEQLRAFVRAEPMLKEVVAARTLTGRALIAQQKWLEAAAEFRQVLVMTPSNVGVRRLRADSLFSAESYAEAAAEYRTYLVAQPADGDAYTNLAISLDSTSKRAESLAAFRRVAELQPKNAVAHANLGRALALEGKLGDAKMEFERALQIDPGNRAAREDLDQLLRSARR